MIGRSVCQSRARRPQLAGLPHGRVTPLEWVRAERQARAAVSLWVAGGFSRWFCTASVMAAAAEESMSAAALVMSVPDSIGQSPEPEGVGAGDEEKDAATKGTAALGDSEEDEEDVFEVERILDMKCEGVCGG